MARPSTQFVDHQCCERLALDVLSDDDERLRGLDNRFEQRQELLQARELLFVDQYVGVFHLDAHLVGVGDEVRRDVAAVELHPFDHFELGLQGLRFLDGNHALVADLLHRIGEKLPDFGIAVRRDRANLRDLLVGRDFLGILLQVRNYRLDGEVDAAFEVHRVHARSNRLAAFLDNGLGKNGCGGRAIPGEVRGLRGDFAHHLRAHVLELIFELDLLGDSDAVLGDARCAERLVDCVGEDVHAAQHAVARVD